jgi:hypothetical protein
MNMKTLRWLRHTLAWFSLCGICAPASFVFGTEATTQAKATSGAPRGSLVRDVALAQGGLLLGQILDESMQPLAGVDVAIQSGGQTMATTKTDSNGTFAVAGLRGGLHQITTRESLQNCRLWAPGTAPPSATEHLRFVPGQDTVIRGQWGPGAPSPWMHKAKAMATNPWVIGGVVATAIAVPVLVHNLDDDDNGS